MAVAFAEAGEWKTAEQFMEELNFSTNNTTPKMLFASADREFSPNVIEYAVSLAARLKLDILALNIFQPSTGYSRTAGSVDSNSRKRFQQLLEMQNLLQEKTRELGIRCDQAVLMDDMRTTIAKVSRLIRRIELVIIQRNQDKGHALNLNIPVYMVTPIES